MPRWKPKALPAKTMGSGPAGCRTIRMCAARREPGGRRRNLLGAPLTRVNLDPGGRSGFPPRRRAGWGSAALSWVVSARVGSRVVLEADPRLDRVDRYGRLLRYVRRDGLNVNVELVRRGAAAPYFHGGDRGRYAGALTQAASSAKRAKRGLWTACPGIGAGPVSRRRDRPARPGRDDVCPPGPRRRPRVGPRAAVTRRIGAPA